VIIIAGYTMPVFLLLIIGVDHVSIDKFRVCSQEVMQNLLAFQNSCAELQDKTVLNFSQQLLHLAVSIRLQQN
jgi:hypothetical protein